MRSGNTETYAPVTLTKDTAPPAVPTVTLSAATDSGVLGDWITNFSQPVFNVAGEVGAIVKVYVDGVLYTAGTVLTNGSHTVTATLTDAAGNTSAPTAVQTLMVSGANTFVTSMVVNTGLSLTNHRLITFVVAATSSAGGVTVTISINGGPPIYSGAIAGAPTSIMLPATETAYTVTVVFTDAAANTSTLTSTGYARHERAEPRRHALAADERHVLRHRRLEHAHVDRDRCQRRRRLEAARSKARRSRRAAAPTTSTC